VVVRKQHILVLWLGWAVFGPLSHPLSLAETDWVDCTQAGGPGAEARIWLGPVALQEFEDWHFKIWIAREQTNQGI
jgi:hypothetical protein